MASRVVFAVSPHLREVEQCMQVIHAMVFRRLVAPIPALLAAGDPWRDVPHGLTLTDPPPVTPVVAQSMFQTSTLTQWKATLKSLLSRPDHLHEDTLYLTLPVYAFPNTYAVCKDALARIAPTTSQATWGAVIGSEQPVDMVEGLDKWRAAFPTCTHLYVSGPWRHPEWAAHHDIEVTIADDPGSWADVQMLWGANGFVSPPESLRAQLGARLGAAPLFLLDPLAVPSSTRPWILEEVDTGFGLLPLWACAIIVVLSVIPIAVGVIYSHRHSQWLRTHTLQRYPRYAPANTSAAWAWVQGAQPQVTQ